VSNNYGHTWRTVSSLPGSDWSAVSTDSTGTFLVAAQVSSVGGNIYYSTDAGVTWINSFFKQSKFVALCQFSSGSIIYAANGGGPADPYQGFIYFSNDHGKTWQQTGSPQESWAQLACDSSGQNVTATVFTGYVYTSSDYGATWIPHDITLISPSPNVPSTSNSSSLLGGAIAGIVIGTFAGVALIGVVVAVYVFWVDITMF
jgi:hypothetical protein